MNWPPADLKFDKEGLRLIVLSKLCTILCVFNTFKMDWDLQSEPLIRYHRGMDPIRLCMPLDIVNIPGEDGKADLCLAIMCSMAGKIYIFRLPSPIEIWNKIRILE